MRWDVVRTRATCRSAFGAVYVLLVASASPQAAADWFTVLVNPTEITKRAAAAVAAVAQPEQWTARKGESLGDLVRRHCGSISPGYIDLLRKQGVPGLPPTLTEESRFTAETKVTLPACLPLRQYASAPVASAAASTSAVFPASVQEQQVWSTINLKSTIDAAAAAKQLEQALSTSGQPTPSVEDPTDIHIYDDLSSQNLLTLGACQTPSGAAAYSTSPYNVLEVLQVLSFDLHALSGTERGGSATIVIPDTGLFTGRQPFSDELVQRIVVNTDPGDKYAGIRPYADQADSEHGTYVATVALGGPDFMQLLDSLDVRLRVAPLNMLSANGKPCVVPGASRTCPVVMPDVFNNAVREAERMNAIVNLSVGRAVPFGEISDHLTPGSHTLFVVAAGNDQVDLATRQVYPARYGGANNDGRYNLITVAALDLDGRRAAFSNFGSAYVDIAAPGCLLPVLAKDVKADEYERRQASGTSFAAPLVSFTAALLQTVWPHATPRQLRFRILVAANISPLVDVAEIQDSRILDVGKTLSIYQDVIDASIGGKTKRLRGRIDSSRTLFDFCNGGQSFYRSSGRNHKRIRKIALVTKPTANFLIYWESDDGVFGSTLCPKEPLTLKIRDDFTNGNYELHSDDLLDVVFAEEH